MKKYFAVDRGVDFVSGRVRGLSLAAGVMALCLGVYHTFWGLKDLILVGLYTEQLGMGIAFSIMAFAQIPPWLMAESNRSNLTRSLSLVVWFLLNMGCILIHVALR